MRSHRENMHREENVSVVDCFKLQCRGCSSGSFTLEQEPQLMRHIKTCPGWQSKEVQRIAVSRTLSNINKHLVEAAREREPMRKKEEMRGPSSRGDSRREERSMSRESSRIGRSRDERPEHYPRRDQEERGSNGRSRRESSNGRSRRESS